MANEVAVYEGASLGMSITELGNALYDSGMFGCKSKTQGQVLAIACATERKSPIELKRRYHLMGGDLMMRSDAMLAEFRAIHGGKHRIIERTPDRAAVELELDGNKNEFSITWAEAQAEPFPWTTDKRDVLKKNYATPRARSQMLWARVVSDGVRSVCPEVNAGFYTPEEFDHSSDASASNGSAAATSNGKIEPKQPGDIESLIREASGGKKETEPGTALNQKPDLIIPDSRSAAAPSLLATQHQLDELSKLLDQMGADVAVRQAIAAKRGVKMFGELPVAAAQDLIETLQTEVDKRKAAKEKKVEQAANEVGDALAIEPCTDEQVARIKSLLVDLGNPELTRQIANKLNPMGMKLADMSSRDALHLSISLSQSKKVDWPAGRELDRPGKRAAEPEYQPVDGEIVVSDRQIDAANKQKN